MKPALATRFKAEKPHDLAAELNVPAERIRQIKQKAMRKMQATLTLCSI